jgi:hypothetical protein
MRLHSDIRAKTIRLWRGGLLVSLMHDHLHASEENGCGMGPIGIQRRSTARREGYLYAAMMFNMYSKHRRTEEGEGASFLHIRR